MSKAREAALKALELDESLAEAHRSLCLIKWEYDWDRAGAQRACERGWELRPGSAEARLDRGIGERRLRRPQGFPGRASASSLANLHLLVHCSLPYG